MTSGVAPRTTQVICDELHEFGYTWATTPDGFARYVRWLFAQALPDTPRPEG